MSPEKRIKELEAMQEAFLDNQDNHIKQEKLRQAKAIFKRLKELGVFTTYIDRECFILVKKAFEEEEKKWCGEVKNP